MFRQARIEVFSRLGVWFTKPLFRTLTWEWDWLFRDVGIGRNAPPSIIAFWHGRQLMLPWVYDRFLAERTDRKLYALNSLHSDGRIIAKIAAAYGLGSVSGSTTRGGIRALVGMVHRMEEGNDAAISPDGPKGPIYKVNRLGVIELAKHTGAPIFPVSYSPERAWTVNSWDKFVIPKPYSRVVGVCGEPMFVPRKASAEESAAFGADLEKRLNEVTAHSDSYFKMKREVQVIAPGPVTTPGEHVA